MYDETSDISATRVLCILAMFFNERFGKIDIGYAGMLSVPQATGEALFSSFKKRLILLVWICEVVLV